MSKPEAGFTLIELLLVLTIILILSSLVIPSMVNVVQEIEINHFLKELESDVLYAQSHALGESDYIRISFEKNCYRMTNTHTEKSKVREYPVGLTHNSTRVVTFNRYATVKGATSFILSNNRSMYRLVFPLGKGRHYVEKQ